MTTVIKIYEKAFSWKQEQDHTIECVSVSRISTIAAVIIVIWEMMVEVMRT